MSHTTPTDRTTPAPGTHEKPVVARVTLRLNDLPEILGISPRSIARERAAGRFPKPDLRVGRMPLWRPETIREWVKNGGRA